MSTTDTFYADAADGSVSKSGAVWATQRAATAGDSRDKTSAVVNVTQVQEFTGTYYIDRGFLTFDTSSIPDTATITAATLYIYASAKSDVGIGDSICVVESLQASATDLVVGDFDSFNTTELASRVTLSSISTSAYTGFALNSSGLAVISKTGFSKFCLRSARDVDNSAPGSGQYAALAIYCSEQTGTSKDPYLEVTYDIYVNKTFTADAIVKAEVTKTLTADAIILPDRWADTLTDTNGTNLEDHTPTGPYGGAAAYGTWSQWYPAAGFARLRINSNKLYSYTSSAIAATSVYRHSLQALNGSFSADLTIPGAHNDGGYVQLGLRANGADLAAWSNYSVIFSNGGTATAGYLYAQKDVAGTVTTLGSYNIGTLSNASTYRVTLVVSGFLVSVKLNGVTVLGPYTDTDVTARGYSDITINTPNGASTAVGVQVDNVLFEPAPTGVTYSFTADAVVAAAVGVATFTADGIVFGTSTKTFTADGIVVTSASKTFTADAVVSGVSLGTSGTRATYGSASTLFASNGSGGTFGAHYGFPDGVMLRDGTHVVTCRKGINHSTYDGCIVVKTKAPGGSWSSEATIFASGGGSSTTSGSGVDWRMMDLRLLSSGRLAAVLYKRTGTLAGYPDDDRFYPVFSYCDGDPAVAANWSTPVAITTSGTVSNWTATSDLVELPDGTLLAATYGTPSLPWTYDRCDISSSADGGATWTYVGTLDPGTAHPTYGTAEAQLEYTLYGKTVAVYRTVNSPWETYIRTSSDDGDTWSSETLIASSSVNRPGLAVAPDGDLILAYGENATTLKFKQSWDQGATWSSAVDTTRSVNIFASPYAIDRAAVSPNVAIVYANETSLQTLASVYYQEITSPSTGYVQRTATVTVDAVVYSGVVTQATRTFTADAIVKAQNLTATLTADAVVAEAVTGLQTYTKTFTADAVVNVTPDATFASGSSFYSVVGQDLHFWAVQ